MHYYLVEKHFKTNKFISIHISSRIWTIKIYYIQTLNLINEKCIIFHGSFEKKVCSNKTLWGLTFFGMWWTSECLECQIEFEFKRPKTPLFSIFVCASSSAIFYE